MSLAPSHLHSELPESGLALTGLTGSLGARTSGTRPSVPNPGLGPQQQPQISPSTFSDRPPAVLSLPQVAVLPFWPLPNVPQTGYLEFPGQAGPFLPLGPQGAGLGQLQGQVVRREWGVGGGSQLQAGVRGWRWEMEWMGWG